jgi:hypothetical protein
MGDRSRARYRGVVLIAMPLVLLACGIDTLNYLGSDSMPASISQSSSGLIFSGPVNPAIPPYIGINLYYRIYASESEAISDRSRLEQKQSSENVPGSSISTFLEATLRYAIPARNENRAPPTIPESLEDDPMSVELIDGRLYLKIGVASSYELKRSLASGLVDFTVVPSDGDADYNNVTSTDPGDYYVQFFAASYGVDLLGSTPQLYSNAVYLGTIVLTDSE